MKRFVTTPIFYVNAAPHIGHLYSMVLADVANRFNKLNGLDSIMSTGTDEHGTKVARAAKNANLQPKVFVDQLSMKFKNLASLANIEFTRFIRTTDKDHEQLATDIWNQLTANQMVYKSKHSGYYCVSDECFYPEDMLYKDGDGNLKSKESDNLVEWLEEENYFFKLSSMKQKLIDLFKTNKQFVLPKQRHQALLNELETSELADLSISRPLARCPWGIKVPNSEDTMYVWFEALVNYLTVSKSCGEDYWPANHIIGKDIVRFHAIYWPAFLLACGLKVPKNVVVHSHWLIDGSKMSKSKQNVVDPILLINKFGLDTVRYTLCHDSVLEHDTPFSVDRVVLNHNVNLVNKWMNLALRVCGPKFNINEAIKSVENVKFGIRETCLKHADEFEFGKYTRDLNKFAIKLNQDLEEAAPWKDPTSLESKRSIGVAAEGCRVLSILMQPVTPGYACDVLNRLGVKQERRLVSYAECGTDDDFGVNVNKKGGHILKRIEQI